MLTLVPSLTPDRFLRLARYPPTPLQSIITTSCYYTANNIKQTDKLWINKT